MDPDNNYVCTCPRNAVQDHRDGCPEKPPRREKSGAQESVGKVAQRSKGRSEPVAQERLATRGLADDVHDVHDVPRRP